MTHHPDAPELDAARLLLAKMGLSPEDLLGTSAPKPQAPTFADYIPEVAKRGTKRVNGTYWNRILEHWGHRHLDEPTTLEIQQLAETIRSQVVVRRNAHHKQQPRRLNETRPGWARVKVPRSVRAHSGWPRWWSSGTPNGASTGFC